MANMLFAQVPRVLKDIVSDVDTGRLGLPELQRGYVWKPSKVRDLLDSMMKGYPIGYLMIWDPIEGQEKMKSIGTDSKAFSVPKSLLIDGQQRVTSLYAVMRSKEIVNENFQIKPITISYNPFTNTFEVGDNATKRANEWIYDISDVFLNEPRSFTYITSFIESIAEARKKSGAILTDLEKETVQQNIMALLSLGNYSIPTLTISGNANEEDVADIFVRVNSGGISLGQDDFILTLISVYWQEGRKLIEDFSRSARKPAAHTAYNALFEPTPTHIIRIAMGYGFRRARLHYAYLLLRGRDFETQVYSEDLRNQQFKKLQSVLKEVLDIQTWHEFIKAVESAGYVSKTLISSQNALVYTYALYLIGRHTYKMQYGDLRRIFAKWFFMASISGYYTSSPESRMETDLADLRNINTASEYEALLLNKIRSVFTDDFFNISLVTNLDSSSNRNPVWLGYCAALNILNAKVLFSNLYTRSLFSPSASGTQNALERHHLFPKAYLASIGINDDRDRNNNANFAFIEWTDNLEILDSSPAIYMGEKIHSMTPVEKAEAYEMHALPDNWENMNYFDFLEERRKLIAEVIRRGFEALA